MSNTPETPTIPDLENCLNVHGVFRCLGIVVSNLKTTHEIAGNYPQTHHKFRKHLAHIRKSRKTGSGQVQIFQVWRWPHLVMSRCNMARKLKLLKSLKSGNSWFFPREWVSSCQCQSKSTLRALRSPTVLQPTAWTCMRNRFLTIHWLAHVLLGAIFK